MTQSVPSLGKLWGYVSTDRAPGLFDLGGITGGWIQVTSEYPVAALEVISADDQTRNMHGLAVIEGQQAAPSIYFGHYDVTGDWWTLCAVANTSPDTVANVTLGAYGESGQLGAHEVRTINPLGRVAELMQDLFTP